jgi:hypothetical protein
VGYFADLNKRIVGYFTDLNKRIVGYFVDFPCKVEFIISRTFMN